MTLFSEKKKRVAFLDRDGVINKMAGEHQYVTRVEDFKLNPGTFEMLRTLKDDGFEFIIVTNQRGIARKHLSEQMLTDIHARMKHELEEEGLHILDIFYCPHEKDLCDCRKPKDGLLRKASKKYRIDLNDSLFVSDTAEDIKMAKEFGIGQQILVRSDHPEDFKQTYVKRKIRMAFVKFAGLSAGGSEKLLQIIAANLPKDEFEVDYFFCDAAPYIGDPSYRHTDTDPTRIDFMKRHGVNTIKFAVGAKDITKPKHPWVDTDFWTVFDESKYDIIQACRAGQKEYPFYEIRNTPMIDIISLSSGVDNQRNIARVMHICKWSAAGWTKRGGDSSRIEIVSLPISIEGKEYRDMRAELGLDGKFIFGMHQRPDDSIFSDIPLEAYKKIENDGTAFVLFGCAGAYRTQAEKLGIRNIHFLPASGDLEKILSFLKTLDVYAHGRRDGEVNSQAMAEAMYFGLPIVSHFSSINNGHVECIGDAGMVVSNADQYATELSKLMSDKSYYKMRSDAARRRFAEKYELRGQMKNFIRIYKDVHRDPFPHPVRRLLSSLHYTQNIRSWLAWAYLKCKFFGVSREYPRKGSSESR